MDYEDQRKLAGWVQKRADTKKLEYDELVHSNKEAMALDTNPTITKMAGNIAHEARLHGQALALYELARDMLDPNWLASLEPPKVDLTA